MRKFRRIISVIVAFATVMSMSTLCFIATAESGTGAAAVSDVAVWKLDSSFAIGEVGSTATTSKNNFYLESSDGALNSAVTTVNGVASIVTANGKRAFSKSTDGIIDVTPANGTSTKISFRAPETGTYYYEFEAVLTSTDTAAIRLYTQIGKFSGRYINQAGYGYANANIGNGGKYTKTGLTNAATFTANAGEWLILTVQAHTSDGNATDETQLTIKKFDVYKAADNSTSENFACSIGTESAPGNPAYGNFRLGSAMNAEPFAPVYSELANGWGDPFGDNASNSPNYWSWAFEEKIMNGSEESTKYHQIFITSQTGGIMDMSPKNGVPAIIVYTAQHEGKYIFNASFIAGISADNIKITVATGDGYKDKESGTYKNEYMLSMSEPNFYAETQITTANETLDFRGEVDLKEGQSIWFIAENPLINAHPEVGVKNITVAYFGGHTCTEFEEADCQTARKCVFCGATYEKDPNAHVEKPTYVDNGDGTHTVTYSCCNAEIKESHSFTSDGCICGAYNASEEYVVALTSPVLQVSKGGTVNISVDLTGAATEFASGEVIIGYDPNRFTFDEATFNASAPDGVSVLKSQEDEIILMIMGASKPLGDGFNTVATLPFNANQSADTSTFVLEDAGFSTAKQAERDGLTAAQKYSSGVILPMYFVTLDPVLEGESFVRGLNDYTFTAKLGKSSDYVVTYKVGADGETVTLNAANGVYTIPGAEVTGDIVITAAVKGTAASPNKEYSTLQNGNKLYLILYNRGQDGPLEGAHLTLDVDGNGSSEPVQMIWSDKYQAYCYLVISDTALDVADCTFAVASGVGPVLANSFDVNGTGVLDANDAQLAYNMYNFDYSTFDKDITMEKYLLADANGDMVINVNDVTKICSECATSEQDTNQR